MPSQTLLKRPAAAGLHREQAVSPTMVLRAAAQEAEVPEWYGVADDEAQNQVFLVTAAKLVNEEDKVEMDGEQQPPPLKDPATITKLEFRKAIQDSVANPMYDRSRGGRPPTRCLEVDVYVGVMEGELEKQHHHAALSLFTGNHRFLPFKAAMRWRWGIATHWSTSHSQLWSTIRYLHCTTPHKPVVDRKPMVWTRDGRKLNLFEES